MNVTLGGLEAVNCEHMEHKSLLCMLLAVRFSHVYGCLRPNEQCTTQPNVINKNPKPQVRVQHMEPMARFLKHVPAPLLAKLARIGEGRCRPKLGASRQAGEASLPRVILPFHPVCEQLGVAGRIELAQREPFFYCNRFQLFGEQVSSTKVGFRNFASSLASAIKKYKSISSGTRRSQGLFGGNKQLCTKNLVDCFEFVFSCARDLIIALLLKR